MIITITISTLKNYKFTRLKLFQKKKKNSNLNHYKTFFYKKLNIVEICKNLKNTIFIKKMFFY